MLYELGDILFEEGEGRVGDDDVRLFQELDAFGAAEVAAFREAACGCGGSAPGRA